MQMTSLMIVDFNWLRNQELITAERESQLPLRLAFIGLAGCCDRKGRFCWDPHRLKALIFPFEKLDMSEVLRVLRKSGFIKKYLVQDKSYGWIPVLQCLKPYPSKLSRH